MGFLRSSGITVPDDISVIGFDGSREARISNPVLTTVAQDNPLRAKTAIDLLAEMISGDTAAKTVRIPVRLIEGKSARRITKE